MANANKFTQNFDPNDGNQDAAAERINSAARDKVDEAQGQAQKQVDDTPKTAEDMAAKMGSAPQSKRKGDKKTEERERAKKKGTLAVQKYRAGDYPFLHLDVIAEY